MVSDEEARAAAREILSEPRFERWDGQYDAWIRVFQELVDRIPPGLIEALIWFQEVVLEGLLGGFLSTLIRFLSLFGVFGESSAAIGWTAVVLLLAVVLVLVYRARGGFGSARVEGSISRDRIPGHANAVREARRLASEGRFLAGAHQLQLAVLARLIETGWLELGRSDPNRTLRQRAMASSLPESESGALIELVDRLEVLWFDEQREDATLYDDWLEFDARIENLGARPAL